MLGQASKYRIRLLLGVAVGLLAMGWFIALVDNWQVQDGAGDGQLATAELAQWDACPPGLENEDRLAAACFLSTSRLDALDTGESESSVEKQGSIKSRDDVISAGATSDLEDRLDPYDPSTWPDDVTEDSGSPPPVQIDLYDPDTWPSETELDDADQALRGTSAYPIDLFDPTTWPSDTGIKLQASAEQGVELDIYDQTTWPSGSIRDDLSVPVDPVDPYDASSWPSD
ncbi:MAG: hypothetical protein O2936_14570 [Proteobacteria bacterium]|jgi:hypothetical protein|nr:hypothetical protein [Pseudomonadota bacterium]MDA0959061.1 hypothetical protein [Pseudomonadota bacterium]